MTIRKTTNDKQTGRRGKPADLLRQNFGKRCNATVRLYLDAALSDNTHRSYNSDLKQFAAWGGVIPASAESVAAYIAHHALTLSCATLSRRVVAIGRAHTAQGIPSPTHSLLVKATLQGVRRKRGCTPRQVTALQKNDVVRLVNGLQGIRGLRDKALLLIGFAAAFRRSELVSLDVEDIEFADEGVVIQLRRSKTDQNGRGRVIAIPYVRGRHCPCRALKTWLDAACIETGALFRRINRYDQLLPDRLTAQAVALIIKSRVAAVGLNPDLYSGHSLRAGFAIFAHNHPSGVSEPSRADELLTLNLKTALALVDVKVLDHFVVAGAGWVSFAERGLL